MKVELVSVSASDDMVVKAAKVSTLGTQSLDAEASVGLINYLMSNKHMSPFEHNSFTFMVQAPIFVTREMLRHRISSFNEESGRYRELDTLFYYPDQQRPLRQVGKTGDYQFEMANELREKALLLMDDAYGNAEQIYHELLELGVAKEVARMVLPVGVYSTIYFTVNARSLMNFLDLRLANNAQWEIRWVAKQMLPHFAQAMPVTYNAWINTRTIDESR